MVQALSKGSVSGPTSIMQSVFPRYRTIFAKAKPSVLQKDNSGSRLEATQVDEYIHKG